MGKGEEAEQVERGDENESEQGRRKAVMPPYHCPKIATA